jgi:hypothetical protein
MQKLNKTIEKIVAFYVKLAQTVDDLNLQLGNVNAGKSSVKTQEKWLEIYSLF